MTWLGHLWKYKGRNKWKCYVCGKTTKDPSKADPKCKENKD